MENISNRSPKKERDVFYYRQRMKNRFFTKIISFFAEESERTGITKKDLAILLKRDPGQISRLLSNPSNMTLETISDLLFALDAEAEPPRIVRFSERSKPNYAHPLIARVTGANHVSNVRRIPLIAAEDTSKATTSVLIEPMQEGKVLNLSLVG